MLFDGERIEKNAEADSNDSVPFHLIDEKYARGEVRIVTEQARYPLVTIPSLICDSEQYKMNPDYQRRHRWDNVKRSRLIESFIINVPVPPIFLYENDYSSYEVMDGLQRLTTIQKFYNDDFALEGLSEWKELNGLLYSELPGLVKKGIDRRYISSIILLQETAKNKQEALRLKQMVFERINSGGVQLTPQESRNAIYDGPLNHLCLKLSENEHFKYLWQIDVNAIDADDYQDNKFYRTMQDVELVLRFFAERQANELQKNELIYLKDYLDYFLMKGNFFPERVLNELKALFNSTIALARGLFGEKAFWLFKKRKNGWDWFNRPTNVVYDPLMFALSTVVGQADLLLQKKVNIQEGIEEFYREKSDLFEGRTTTRPMLASRQKAFIGFLSQWI